MPKFTESKCVCPICKDMNKSQQEWDKLVRNPKTNLQDRMKKVIETIEKRYHNKN